MKRTYITIFVLAILLAIGIMYFSGTFSAGTTTADTTCKDGDGHDDCDKEKEKAGLKHQEGEEEHAEDDGHGHSEDAHAHKGIITLKDSTIKQFGIELAEAGPGTIGIHTTLPAEIALNGDRIAHVVPRIPGVVRSVIKTLGDKVQAGEVLAIIHSRELADYKAGYLGAREKITLAETMYEREKSLWEKKITAEQEYLKAKRDVADARIELRSAEQKLHALGFSEEYLKNLPNHPEDSLIVYEIVAPIDGTIVEKHITIGEVLKDDSEPFVIADLSNVWVNVNIHQKDLPSVKQNQKAVLKTEHNQAEGVVSYVSSVVDENTRTALARIILSNDSGQWRAGTFATAEIYTEEIECGIVVPKDAIVTVEGKSIVFVPVEEGFKPQQVQLGRVNGEYIEIVSGLEQGQQYVAKGAFTLKSEMNKSTEDPCGGH
ncbi:MAG: efflux RND transporter periplasmic adaptor subunit [Sedimentisphaerales bacterium]|nr:efflux RND transporter periplasmic adaptor subunit [Sedimentisphaerales bacterium]